MRSLLGLVAVILYSCSSPALPESRGDKLAKSLCDCSEQLMALNQQAEKSSDSLSFRNIATAFEKTRACAAKLGIKAEDTTALRLALATQCPALAAHPDILPELLGK